MNGYRRQVPGARGYWLLALFLSALFAAGMFGFSRHNDFPYYCHADEHTKVEQVLSRDFNFRHPQLLLVATDLARRALDQREGFQQITMTGRWVSTGFASISVVLLSLLAWRGFGLLGAWCVGLALLVCPIIGLTAHFLKEDTCLLLGFSASLLAMDVWLEKPNGRRTVALGLACGLAVSAKYIGALFLLLPLVLVCARSLSGRQASRRYDIVLLLLPALLVFIALNFPLFSDFHSFVRGLNRGAKLVAHGRHATDLPNLLVFKSLGGLSWQVMLLAGIGLGTLSIFYRRLLSAWAIVGAGALFTGMLLITPLGVPDRYILIPAVSLHLLAGLGIAMIAQALASERSPQPWRAAATSATLAAIGLAWLATPVYQSIAVDAFYQADARAELIQWVNSRLGPEAKIAMLEIKGAIRLPSVDGLEPARADLQFLGPAETIRARHISREELHALRRDGITHVVMRQTKWRGLQDRLDKTAGDNSPAPQQVWRTPEHYRSKNRWLRADLVVIKL